MSIGAIYLLSVHLLEFCGFNSRCKPYILTWSFTHERWWLVWVGWLACNIDADGSTQPAGRLGEPSWLTHSQLFRENQPLHTFNCYYRSISNHIVREWKEKSRIVFALCIFKTHFLSLNIEINSFSLIILQWYDWKPELVVSHDFSWFSRSRPLFPDRIAAASHWSPQPLQDQIWGRSRRRQISVARWGEGRPQATWGHSGQARNRRERPVASAGPAKAMTVDFLEMLWHVFIKVIWLLISCNLCKCDLLQMSINLGTVSIENNTVGRLFANKKGSLVLDGSLWSWMAF